MTDRGPESAGPAKAPKRGIGAIDTGLRLLDVLAGAQGSMQLKEIAALSGMPAAKAHRYLASFIAAGMVSQSESSSRYDLGPMALRIGVAALNRFDVIERASAGLRRLRDDIRATCFVSGWTDKGPIILRWEDSRRPLTVIVQTGSTMPVLASATGRAYLAFLPSEHTSELVRQELAGDGVTTGDASERLRALIEETRRTGMGRTDGDFQPGIAALAAPLFDPFGQMVGAVAALGRSGEFDGSYTGTVASALREFTKSLVGET